MPSTNSFYTQNAYKCRRMSHEHPAVRKSQLLSIILVDLGDFGQIPGPSSSLFWRAAGAAFSPHYYFLRI
jgi:hypothetical protein